MASSEQEQEPNQEQEPLPEVFESEEPPPRPTTPPVRRGFLMVLLILILAATMVYGIPFIAGRAGYAWEAGRSLAATEALAKLGKDGVIDRAGSLFRIATVAVSPAVVNIKSEKLGNQARGGDGLCQHGHTLRLCPPHGRVGGGENCGQGACCGLAQRPHHRKSVEVARQAQVRDDAVQRFGALRCRRQRLRSVRS